MKLLAPPYYQKFHCVAEACRHNCCIGWEIDIDDKTLAAYEALGGEVGAQICQGIEKGEAGACFRLQPNGRCAHLSEQGLCRIITALGEGYLCDICREHPRFYHTVGDVLEVGLGASCEEAARLILAEADYMRQVAVGEVLPDGQSEAPAVFDAAASRTALFAILSDSSLTYEARLERIMHDFSLGVRLTSKEELHAQFASLEYLEAAHKSLFLQAVDGDLPTSAVAPLERERFLAYLVYRHASPSKTRRDFQAAVSLSLLLEQLFACLIGCCGLVPGEAARILSEELEYSEDNTQALCFALELAAI